MINEKERRYDKINREKAQSVICQCLIDAGLLRPDEVRLCTSILEHFDNKVLISKLCDLVNIHSHKYLLFRH